MNERVAEETYNFAVAICAASRMTTLAQVARHPLLRDRGSPQKRAWEALEPRRKDFDVAIGKPGLPSLWRLTNDAKERLGLQYKNVPPFSQKTLHWLSIGDLWIEMTQRGGRPQHWQSEPQGMFDVVCEWHSIPWYIEIQRRRIGQETWRKKWDARFRWLKDYRGYVVCIDHSGSGKPHEGVRYFENEERFVSAVNRAVIRSMN